MKPFYTQDFYAAQRARDFRRQAQRAPMHPEAKALLWLLGLCLLGLVLTLAYAEQIDHSTDPTPTTTTKEA